MCSNILRADQLETAVSILLSGELLVFPTDTVYGLGGNAYNDKVVEKIFLYKQRDRSKPLSICYSCLESALQDVELSEKARIFAENSLPGAITMIVRKKKNSKISKLCCTDNGTIGIRVPNNKIALNLLKKLPFPLAAPSANRSGEPSTSTAESALNSLKCKDLYALGSGNSLVIGTASTIIDFTEDTPKILRQGAYILKDFES